MKVKSYIKDTNDFLHKLKALEEVEEGLGEGFTNHNDPEDGDGRWRGDVKDNGIMG